MHDHDDLICRYTVCIGLTPDRTTIGFIWSSRSTGETVAQGQGFRTQEGMRAAREVAYRNVTQRTPGWAPSQYPEAA